MGEWQGEGGCTVHTFLRPDASHPPRSRDRSSPRGLLRRKRTPFLLYSPLTSTSLPRLACSCENVSARFFFRSNRRLAHVYLDVCSRLADRDGAGIDVDGGQPPFVLNPRLLILPCFHLGKALIAAFRRPPQSQLVSLGRRGDGLGHGHLYSADVPDRTSVARAMESPFYRDLP